MPRFAVLEPAPAFVVPVIACGIPTVFDKREKFTVARQILTRVKVGYRCLEIAILVVPAVNVVAPTAALFDATAGHRQQRVSRRLARIDTVFKQRRGFNQREG